MDAVVNDGGVTAQSSNTSGFSMDSPQWPSRAERLTFYRLCTPPYGGEVSGGVRNAFTALLSTFFLEARQRAYSSAILALGKLSLDSRTRIIDDLA